ncbi:MAG: hypothetical protein ACHQRM_13280 [Bacteroidia bacterium]
MPFARCSNEPQAAEKAEKLIYDSTRLADSVLNFGKAEVKQTEIHCDSQKILVNPPASQEINTIERIEKEEPLYKRVFYSLVLPEGNYSGLAFAISAVEAIIKREDHIITTLPPLIAYLAALLVFVFSLLNIRRYWKKILVLSITGLIGVFYILICVGKDWMYGIPVTLTVWTINLILSWRIYKLTLPSPKPTLADSSPDLLT